MNGVNNSRSLKLNLPNHLTANACSMTAHQKGVSQPDQVTWTTVTCNIQWRHTSLKYQIKTITVKYFKSQCSVFI